MEAGRATHRQYGQVWLRSVAGLDDFMTCKEWFTCMRSETMECSMAECYGKTVGLESQLFATSSRSGRPIKTNQQLYLEFTMYSSSSNLNSVK